MAYDWNGRGQPDNLFECSHSDSVDRIQDGASRHAAHRWALLSRSGLELPKRGGLAAQEASEVGGRVANCQGEMDMDMNTHHPVHPRVVGPDRRAIVLDLTSQ